VVNGQVSMEEVEELSMVAKEREKYGK